MNYQNLNPFTGGDIEIKSLGHCYDLHNNADFYEIRNDVRNREVILIWKYPGEWYLKEGQKHWKENEKYLEKNDLVEKTRFIALIFSGVSCFEIRPRDSEIPFSEDNCLAGMYNFDMKSEKEALVFEFMSGMEIIIDAENLYFDRDFKMVSV